MVAQDRAAQGRACGNLGNVHYLLGDFAKAIHYHQVQIYIIGNALEIC